MAFDLLNRIDLVNPLTTGVATVLTSQFADSWKQRPDYWDPSEWMAKSTTTNDREVIPFPFPPLLPTQTTPGGHMRDQQMKAVSITVRQKLYKSKITIQKYAKLNAVIGDMSELIFNYASSCEDELLAVVAGQVLAANPIMTKIDNVAFFGTHAINAFNSTTKSVTNNSATQPNLFGSKPFNATNLDSVLNSIQNFAWPNGLPCYANKFDIFMPLGNSIFKAAHLIYGDLIGGAFNSSMVSGASDVGSNQNIYKAAKDRWGFSIGLHALPQYTGTSTDWYIATNIIKPFVHVQSLPLTPVMITDEQLESVAIKDEIALVTAARFAVALTHPLAMVKCTA
jgi:hypothetical protein